MDELGDEARKMAANAQRKQKKKEVCESVLSQLVVNGYDAAAMPGFAEDLHAHFNRLPTRFPLTSEIPFRDLCEIGLRLL